MSCAEVFLLRLSDDLPATLLALLKEVPGGDRLRAAARPGIRLHAIEVSGNPLEVGAIGRFFGRKTAAELPPTTSKLGGYPYAQSTSDWPLTQRGHPYQFVGQINFGEFENQEGLPEEGVLSLYFSEQGGADLFRWTWYPKVLGHACLLVRGPSLCRFEHQLVGRRAWSIPADTDATREWMRKHGAHVGAHPPTEAEFWRGRVRDAVQVVAPFHPGAGIGFGAHRYALVADPNQLRKGELRRLAVMRWT